MTKTAKPVGVVGQLSQLHSIGWRYDFDLGEWIEPRRWQMERPSEDLSETMLSVACGEACHSCLKAKALSEGRCLSCYGLNRGRHPALDQIDAGNQRDLA